MRGGFCLSACSNGRSRSRSGRSHAARSLHGADRSIRHPAGRASSSAWRGPSKVCRVAADRVSMLPPALSRASWEIELRRGQKLSHSERAALRRLRNGRFPVQVWLSAAGRAGRKQPAAYGQPAIGRWPTQLDKAGAQRAGASTPGGRSGRLHAQGKRVGDAWPDPLPQHNRERSDAAPAAGGDNAPIGPAGRGTQGTGKAPSPRRALGEDLERKHHN
jgi:hypothetical protein